ncbi:MAG: hypothetical protein RL398_270 [Planctomycetota bacterium]
MKARTLVFLTAALAWSGCSTSAPPRAEAAVAPTPLPERFAAAPTTTNGELREDWWREFGDPSLDRAVAAALATNHGLVAAAERMAAAVAASGVTRGPLQPTVDAGFDAGRARRVFLGFPFGGGGVPSSTTTTYGVSLNVQWELDIWGRIAAAAQGAAADAEGAAALLDAARLSLVGQVCKAHFAVCEAELQLRLADETVATLRSTAADVRDRYRRGLRPAIDLHQAEANAAEAEAAAAARTDALQRARRQLDLLCGRYPHGEGDGDRVLGLPATLPEVPSMLPSELLLRRPDLAAAERTLAAVGCRVEAAKAALYPRISLTASGGTSSTELKDLVDDDFRVFSIGANLLQPLFRGGADRAEIARQEALQRQALADYRQAVLQAFTEVESALGANDSLDRRRLELAKAARSAATARDLARERWQQGIAEFLAVADGQRQAFGAESARLSSERQRLDNRIDLLLALGGGYRAAATGEKP